MPTSIRLFIPLLLSVLLTGGCGQSTDATAPAKPVHWVKLATATAAPLADTALRTGSLRALRSVKLHVQEEGRVAEVNVYAGDAVQAGDVLLKLDDALLRAQLASATATRQQAEQDHARLRGLVAKRLVAEDQATRAATAAEVARADETLLRTRLGYTVIRAPFAGIVSLRSVEPGDVVARHDHVLSVYDPDSLITELGVSELLLPQLKVDDRVSLRIDALGEETFQGRILRLHPEIDARTRQALVEIALDPVPAGARPGQLCRVTLTAPARSALQIPLTALRRDAEGEYVMVMDAEQRVHRRNVSSGARQGESVEIRTGIEPGAQVVVQGLLGLSDGKAVQVNTTENPAAASP